LALVDCGSAAPSAADGAGALAGSVAAKAEVATRTAAKALPPFKSEGKEIMMKAP
jgi:hypothetical protein